MEEHKVTLRIKTGWLGTLHVPVTELLIDGRPFSGSVQAVKIEIDADTQLPTVTLRLIPAVLEVAIDNVPVNLDRRPPVSSTGESGGLTAFQPWLKCLDESADPPLIVDAVAAVVAKAVQAYEAKFGPVRASGDG